MEVCIEPNLSLKQMKIDNCLLQQQLRCATQSAGRARAAVGSNTDRDSTYRQTKQSDRDIYVREMSVANYARQHVVEGMFVIVCLYKVYSLPGSLALP